MSYCQGKTKGQIKFKYPNDIDWQIFNTDFPPVDYTINSDNYLWVVQAPGHKAGLVYPCNNPGWIPYPGYPNYVKPACNGIRIDAVEIQYGGALVSLLPITLEAANSTSISSLYLDYRNFAKCKFTITDTRGKIYERSKSTCPTVMVVCGDSCPPNTICECDCGTEVCCYDTTGTPIFSYPK